MAGSEKMDLTGGLNGSAKAVYTAIGAAASIMSIIGGILVKSLTDTDVRLERQMEQIRDEAKDDRASIEARLQSQIVDILKGRLETAERVRALEASTVEIETQFRALSTVHNLERQRDSDITDLLQQCPLCKLPQRVFYPPSPGGSNGTH
jgi:hypothetical protein